MNNLYNNPSTFIPTKPCGDGLSSNTTNLPPKHAPDLASSPEDEYVIVQAGVKRMPEEIYDMAVCNPLQISVEESEEEQYDEAYDPDPDRYEGHTNL